MSERTPEAQATIDSIGMLLFGRKQTKGECVMCGSLKMNTSDFKDEISIKESKITYQCQSCQDEFNAYEDEMYTEDEAFEENEGDI